MAPPTFADLGKSARDLFSKGYNHGFLKVESTTKTGDSKGEIEFKTVASHNLASQKLGGNFDIKYKIPQYGLTLTEKWNTENQLGTVIEVNEQFAKGLKVTLDSIYAPHSGKRSAKLKADWANPNAHLTTDIGLTASPVINAAGVVGKDGWLLGGSAGLDTATSRVVRPSFAFGHSNQDYTFHSFVIDLSEFGGSLYHKVAGNVELGAQFGWKMGGNSTSYSVGTKYSPNPTTILRAKVNNESQVALASTHSLSAQLKLTLSTQFSLHNTDVPKFGLGLEFAN